MNVKNLIAAATVLITGSAIADDTYPYVDHSRFTGTKTRAEVQAELNAAGTTVFRQQEFVDHINTASGKSRAEVRAELERAYAQGYGLANRTPEFVEFTRVASHRNRNEVRAEAIQAARDTASKSINAGS
jgi:hypothetical protein